jgi:hypothetical protein
VRLAFSWQAWRCGWSGVSSGVQRAAVKMRNGSRRRAGSASGPTRKPVACAPPSCALRPTSQAIQHPSFAPFPSGHTLRMCDTHSCRPTVTVEQLLSFQPLPHPVPLEVRSLEPWHLNCAPATSCTAAHRPSCRQPLNAHAAVAPGGSNFAARHHSLLSSSHEFAPAELTATPPAITRRRP